jgi:hypothetical protein
MTTIRLVRVPHREDVIGGGWALFTAECLKIANWMSCLTGRYHCLPLTRFILQQTLLN